MGCIKMSGDIKVRIPCELVELSGLSLTELEKRSHLLLIFELYQQGKISLSRAAELAGLTVDHFLIEFRKRRLLRQGGPATPKEAEEEFQTALKFLK